MTDFDRFVKYLSFLVFMTGSVINSLSTVLCFYLLLISEHYTQENYCNHRYSSSPAFSASLVNENK